MHAKEDSAYKDLPKIQFIAQPENFGSRIVGEIYQQITPFQRYEHDWNNDGDAYEEKVAKFEKLTTENPHSSNVITLSEYEFRDLKDLKCIEYVKEIKRAEPLAKRLDDAQRYFEQRGAIKPSLAEQLAGAAMKAGQLSQKSEKTGLEDLSGR